MRSIAARKSFAVTMDKTCKRARGYARPRPGPSHRWHARLPLQFGGLKAVVRGPVVVEGRAMILLGRVCAVLRHTLTEDLRKTLRATGRVDEELAAAVAAVDREGLRWLADREVMSGDGHQVASTRADGPLSAHDLTAEELAPRLGCTSRHVRRLAADGHLRGEKRHGVWHFPADTEGP